MHLMQKCILAYIFQRKMFSVHFPKENVQLCKNAFDAKMHFCVHFPLENVQHHILRSKMFSITFSKGKCSAKSKKTKHSKKQRQCVHFVGAEHFPKENVQHHIFLWKMFSKATQRSSNRCTIK